MGQGNTVGFITHGIRHPVYDRDAIKRFPIRKGPTDFAVVIKIGPVGATHTHEGRDVGPADRHCGHQLGPSVRERHLLGRPQFEGDAAAQGHGRENIQLNPTLGADQRRVHVQINGVAACIDLETKRIDLAVAVDIRRVDHRNGCRITA